MPRDTLTVASGGVGRVLPPGRPPQASAQRVGPAVGHEGEDGGEGSPVAS
jgi:hypothetical protein